MYQRAAFPLIFVVMLVAGWAGLKNVAEWAAFALLAMLLEHVISRGVQRGIEAAQKNGHHVCAGTGVKP